MNGKFSKIHTAVVTWRPFGDEAAESDEEQRWIDAEFQHVSAERDDPVHLKTHDIVGTSDVIELFVYLVTTDLVAILRIVGLWIADYHHQVLHRIVFDILIIIEPVRNNRAHNKQKPSEGKGIAYIQRRKLHTAAAAAEGVTTGVLHRQQPKTTDFGL